MSSDAARIRLEENKNDIMLGASMDISHEMQTMQSSVDSFNFSKMKAGAVPASPSPLVAKKRMKDS